MDEITLFLFAIFAIAHLIVLIIIAVTLSSINNFLHGRVENVLRVLGFDRKIYTCKSCKNTYAHRLSVCPRCGERQVMVSFEKQV